MATNSTSPDSDDRTKTPARAVRFPSFVFTFLSAVVRHPALVPTAARQLVRTIPRRWWRRPPYLPLPDGGYLRYRVETAYGAAGVPVHAEIVSYLRWCRETDRANGASR